MTLGFLQIGEILTLYSFVLGVVFCHGRCLLFQVTVYGGLVTLSYVYPCLRNTDVHLAASLLQFGQADAPIHDGIAVRANCCQVSKPLGNGTVFRHAARRLFWGAAADTVDFPGQASPFISCPTRLEEYNEFPAENQCRPLVIVGWESSFKPSAHGILVIAAQADDFLYRVAAVDFDTTMVGVTFLHD